ncbi:MAG: hypothetical protein JWO31_811, partial [Phycisphaerales bacterium]|nr:hypothetical protein [Phycisphaerales bacterium]
MTGKQWIVRAASVALLWLSAVPAAARGAAAVPATKPAAADALAANGLTLVGPAYVLGVDAALADALKAVRQAKARQDAYAAKRAQLDRDVKSADRALTDANEQYRAALADLAAARRGTATNTYNQIVARTNTAQLRAADAQREVDRRNKALRDLPAPPDDYVGAVTDLAARMDAAVERYAALAADPAVTAAAAAASAAAKTPLKIGPSARFTQELPGVRRMKDAVVAAAVPCRVEGNTATVMVSLNDAAPVPMIWDSGASDVSLSADAAKAAGIVPGPDDPVVKYRIADGSSVEGRLVRARTIRVGQFTVRDVVCSVSSKSQKNAPLLLGGTFQRNFVARLNLGAGEIHLTPVGSDVTIGGGVAAGSTDAPAKPAPSPSSPAAPAAKAPPRGQVAVRATSTTANPMRTGLMLAAGQQVELIPDPGDRWQGGGTKSGQSCDYRGYPNQRGWMALKWRVGAATGDVVPTEPVVAREAGELLLYCEDEKPAGNNGSIRVTIIPGPPPV